MVGGGINKAILQAVSESTEDRIIKELLIDLLYTEAEHAGSKKWWWKEPFRDRVAEAAERYGADDASR
jgi:hypothetical protein